VACGFTMDDRFPHILSPPGEKQVSGPENLRFIIN
jgi:hypothetical protein